MMPTGRRQGCRLPGAAADRVRLLGSRRVRPRERERKSQREKERERERAREREREKGSERARERAGEREAREKERERERERGSLRTQGYQGTFVRSEPETSLPYSKEPPYAPTVLPTIGPPPYAPTILPTIGPMDHPRPGDSKMPATSAVWLLLFSFLQLLVLVTRQVSACNSPGKHL